MLGGGAVRRPGADSASSFELIASSVSPSVAAWAGATAFRQGAQIDEVARMLGVRSLDQAARLIGWDWDREEDV